MRGRVSGRGYPGHGAVIPSSQAKVDEYITHRQQREEEVVRVLDQGQSSWTPMELVKTIYQDVPESLHHAASHGVLQVLMKLEDEGKAIHDSVSSTWRLSQRKPVL